MPRTLPIALLARRAAAPRLEPRSPPRADTAPRSAAPTGGVPHVKARDYGSLGFGLGYAYAQDQLCEYASIIITVSAQRSRYFGTDAESPNGGTNLQSDFFWQRIKDARTVERLVKRRAPHGPAKAVRAEHQGLRRGLQRLPAQDRPRQAARPDLPRQGVGAPDHDARRLPPLLPARPARQLGQLPARDRRRRAARRAPPRPAAALPTPEQLRERLADDPVLGTSTRSAPTPTASARHGTRGGRSVRARQPALPLAGLRALVRAAPDHPRQARRDRRRRCRACRWSTSASTGTSPGATRSRPRAASRRTSSSSSPATRRSYLVDGKAVKMSARTRLGAHAVRHPAAHVLRDALGAGLRTSRSPALTWTPTNAYALARRQRGQLPPDQPVVRVRQGPLRRRPAPRVGEGAGQPVGQRDRGRLRGPRLLRRRLGRAERRRRAASKRCSTSSKAPLLLSAGVILLDGSKRSCAWGNDRDAVARGILGPKALPRATRRDYVENSNDSYWLPSARFRLTGFPRIIGAGGHAAAAAHAARARAGRAAAGRHRRARPGRLHDRRR